MSKQHKHAELIKAWADGAEIQRYVIVELIVEAGTDEWDWIDDANPDWHPKRKYRIKPKEKQKVKMWQWVMRSNPEASYFVTSNFYSSEEVANTEYPYHELLQRADWTEIEVEID